MTCAAWNTPVATISTEKNQINGVMWIFVTGFHSRFPCGKYEGAGYLKENKEVIEENDLTYQI